MPVKYSDGINYKTMFMFNTLLWSEIRVMCKIPFPWVCLGIIGELCSVRFGWGEPCTVASKWKPWLHTTWVSLRYMYHARPAGVKDMGSINTTTAFVRVQLQWGKWTFCDTCRKIQIYKYKIYRNIFNLFRFVMLDTICSSWILLSSILNSHQIYEHIWPPPPSWYYKMINYNMN